MFRLYLILHVTQGTLRDRARFFQLVSDLEYSYQCIAGRDCLSVTSKVSRCFIFLKGENSRPFPRGVRMQGLNGLSGKFSWRLHNQCEKSL